MRYETATTPLARVVSRKRAREKERNERANVRVTTRIPHRYIYIYTFFRKPFFPLIVFVKGRRSKRQNISQRRTVIPKKVYHHQECVLMCVCKRVLASAHLRIFVCERRRKDSRRQRTYLFYSPLRVDFFPGRDTVTVHGCVRV